MIAKQKVGAASEDCRVRAKRDAETSEKESGEEELGGAVVFMNPALPPSIASMLVTDMWNLRSDDGVMVL